MNFQNLRYSSANLLLLATSLEVFLLPTLPSRLPVQLLHESADHQLSPLCLPLEQEPPPTHLFISLSELVGFLCRLCAHTLVRAAARETSLN